MIVFARDKGRSEGLAEGRAEGAREQAILTARNLLKLDVPVEVIAQGTGLTTEEVKALRLASRLPEKALAFEK